MKRIFAALLALLCLAGCTAKEPEVPVIEEESVVIEQKTEETTEKTERPEAEEVPIKEKTEPAQETEAEKDELPEIPEYKITPVEGLIEDTIGYVLNCPVFADFPAAESVNQYYTELAAYLEKFTRETIYENAIQKQVTANVYGTVDSVELSGEELKIVYAYRVEYSDKQTDENTRTDYFNIQTGETWSE